MKTSIRLALTGALVGALSLLLASCGGGNTAPPANAQAPRMLAAVQSSVQVRTRADYYDVIQHIYLAYFGRPADPGGLDFYAGHFLSHNAPNEIVGLAGAYRNGALDPVIVDVVNSFGTSAESQALYPGSNDSFVTAVYHNLYSREPDGGKSFWVGHLDNHDITRADAAIEIMAGSQFADVDVISHKAGMAAAFTSSLNSDAARAAYSGLDANVVVRNLLLTVGASTDPASYQASIDIALNTLINTLKTNTLNSVLNIIHLRCVGCHSAHPGGFGYTAAPLGIMFDTSAQIHARAEDIYQNAFVSQFMPFGNATHMTDDERAVIGAWHDLGSP
ncbi:MAG: DUF4214 domain-containing protein [Pseudomonadota bacterium]